MTDIKLDKDQYQAVTTNSSEVLVIAGAGSGKTRVLTERVKYLLSQGINPYGIIAITFTNMAADEMKQRLAGVPNSDKVFIGTIHSYANRILRHTGLKYKIYTDELESEYYFRMITNQCKYLKMDDYITYKRNKVKILLGLLNKNSNPMSHMSQEAIKEFYKISDTVGPERNYDTLYSLKKRDNAISFTDIIKYASGASYIKPIHVMVDEFQDVGLLEYTFIRSLNAPNYYFVGDDSQSIYGFKGANVEIFRDIASSSKSTVITLTNNYRSCNEIISRANKILEQILPEDKIEKPTNVIRTDRGVIKDYSVANIRLVLQSVVKNTNYKDWFILARTNKDIIQLGRLLESLDIPFISFSKEGKSFEQISEMMSDSKVKLLTVHAAKGLESPNVLLYGTGFWNFVSTNSKYYNPEERRVMYVGMTRARDQLILVN